MMFKHRFLLILICFLIVVMVPWRTETIIPAQITATSKTTCLKQIPIEKLKKLEKSVSKSLLINDRSHTIVMLNFSCDSTSCKVLTAENIRLSCYTSAYNGLEIFTGQDATFFPESDQINPFHISLQRLHFSGKEAHISGTPLKINQYFEGKIKGLISIKGDRKSLFMRMCNYLFHS
jgi:hypothetical protein